MMTVKRGSLLPLFLLVAAFFLLVASPASAAAAAAAKRRVRQGDALNRLIYDPATWKKRSGLSPDAAVSPAAASFDQSKVLSQQSLKENDKIAKLPGQPDGVDFNQYGGYVTVDQIAGRALYYYFTEAAGADPSSMPLLLWLNGGPGCSSIGYGAMEELGPFRVMSDGKTLFRNPYAWNRAANVLFLESPAGVGYSYSNTTTDYELSGDSRTAEDAYVFLVNWFERFPEYKGRDFYISGESYAGHYVPQLAHNIYHYNQLPDNNNHHINLKGVIVGNAVINDGTDIKGMYDYFWTHALLSDEVNKEINQNCDFLDGRGTYSDDCQAALGEANNVFEEVDIYNIYAPLCWNSNLTALPKRISINNFDPCSDYYVDAYLNNPRVQEALHANVTKLNYPWSACSNLPAWQDSPDTVIPLLQEFMKNGIRVWVYSGDTDGRVPVTSSRYSVDALQLPVKTPWKPWADKGEVGGYSIVYKGDITMATVRGAGHEVPSYRPRRSLVLIKSFLDGKPLPQLQQQS